ncbi:TetR/AcrR family transcriptional regulator [Actinomadura rudentiformis]|uniref:TetR/AcrR family transcriptional regulator n=1 Tax=Actinomadura rudentiformis TaxID=359158 RepID=A0A6H9YKI6_9ACTN|nr:TetR/AcrR family transcriptional regulator [Actinomadura rudentiformis]KAB2341603.1 TetR/AcrR family transcriptional regulator [Actinomadura rudentiformis]
MSATRPGRVRGPYAKSAQRSKEILEAATAVFAARGYHGGTLRDISRQLNLSLTSIVHHFGTKYELLEAVLERADVTVGTGFAPFDFEADCVERGVALATIERVRSNLERPELLRLLAILAAESSAPDHPAHGWFVERYRKKSASLAEAFAYDQTQGRVDAARDPRLLSSLLIGTWDGIQLQWLIDPSHDMERAMRTFFEWAVPEALS